MRRLKESTMLRVVSATGLGVVHVGDDDTVRVSRDQKVVVVPRDELDELIALLRKLNRELGLRNA